jgi:NhaA family Na+:H+ antiporter
VLPVAAAIGGMIVPATLYLALQFGRPGERGWGIPMATDIAFVVGCIAILGSRVPHSLRIMLLSLAIVDDIGAILVIAVGYTDDLSLASLAAGAAGIVLILGLTKLGVRSVGVYTLLGAGVWLAFHESGVHATIAGVILGLITPASRWVGPGVLGPILDRAGHLFRGEDLASDQEHARILRRVEQASREAISPLERIETALHPWVGFVIMPIFALANAGVPIRLGDLAAPVSLAVMAGLVVGKPVGILLACWLAVKLRLAELPRGVGWGPIAAAGCLAGIGFTMALFIAGLALKAPLLDTAKIGILSGSILSALLGVGLMVALLPKRPETSP